MRVSYQHLSKCGRLGNELFELAATWGLAYHRDALPLFNADWIHRPYFSCPDLWFTDNDEPTIDAVELVPHIDPRARDYLQDVNLFLGILDELRPALAASPLAQRQLDEQPRRFWDLPRPVLGVHVRRGDNVQANDPLTPNKHLYHRLPPLDYYQRAIAILEPKAASIAVFTDDPGWCREHLLDVDYVHHGTPRPKEHERSYWTAPVLDHIDLFMLAQCDLHIVTGSTFGIWGALLAGSVDVIYGWPVYGPRLSYINAELLFPTDWRKIGLAC